MYTLTYSLSARLHHQNIAGSLPSIDDTISTISGDNSYSNRELTELASKYLSPDKPLDSESIHSFNSTDYLVDPELKEREAKRMNQASEEIDISDGHVHITSVDGGDDPDGYYVIESDPQNGAFPVGLDSPGTPKLDVDALASKLASLEMSATTEKSHARRVSDSSTASSVTKSPDYHEVMIDGGGVKNVSVTVSKSGTAIVWEFSTEPKGIAFGIWYQENKESQKEVEVRLTVIFCIYI